MKISIVTTSYNSVSTLRDTMESVLRQRYTDYEYIIIDGASTDGTVELIREFEPRFEGRMRWISEPDRGIYDAMNKGITLATGYVVGMLNSDDLYASDDILDTIAGAFSETQGLDAIYGDIHFVDAHNLTKVVRYYSSSHFSRKRILWGYMPAHPSFYVRRECYVRYGAFDISYRIAADFESIVRLVYINNIRTRYIAKDFVVMRTGGASTSGFKSYYLIAREHFRAFRKNGIHPRYILYFIRYVQKLFEFNRKSRKKAVNDLAENISQDL